MFRFLGTFLGLLCWGQLLAVPAAWAQARADVAGAAELRAKAAPGGRIRIIAELAAPDATTALRATPAAATPLAMARPLGSLPYAALEVDAAELEQLLASGAVTRVGINHKVRPSLRESAGQVGMPAARRRGATGAGQHVVIIDTGIRASHPFLAGRVVRSVCSAADCGAKVVDRAGAGEPSAACEATSVVANHGTHVAGIAAGRGSAFSGMAPQAKLISIRVFGCEDADWEYIIRALDYVDTKLAAQYRIAAVNLSLGDDALHFGQACDDHDASYAAMAAVIGKLRRKGIATVASSGNEWVRDGISAPACISHAISVGSVDKTDVVTWLTNSGPNLDLLAPGGDIYSSMASGGFGYMTGTSMAAPHVAGAIAALRSKLPGMSIDRIEQALKTTGRPIKDPENGLVRPRLDVDKALVELMGGAVAGWQEPEELGGRLAQAPECVADGAARIDCVGALAAGALGWWRYEGGRSTGPTALGGSPASPASCLRTGADLQCFVATKGNRLARRTLRAGKWLAWQDLGGSLRGLRPACLSRDGRRIDCVVVGADGRLRARSYDGKAWVAGWREVAAGLAASSAPVCHAGAAGVECLVGDANRRLAWVRQGADGVWQAPKALGGSVASTGSCLADGTKGRACFFAGSDGKLRRIAYDGKVWGAWQDLGGSLGSAPSCVRSEGKVRCLAVTRAGALAERRSSGSAWLPWRDVGGSFLAQAPDCLAPNGVRIDCFARTAGRTLGHVVYD